MDTPHPVFAIMEGVRKRRSELSEVANEQAVHCLVVAEALRLVGEHAAAEGQDWETLLDAFRDCIGCGGLGLGEIAAFSKQKL